MLVRKPKEVKFMGKSQDAEIGPQIGAKNL